MHHAQAHHDQSLLAGWIRSVLHSTSHSSCTRRVLALFFRVAARLILAYTAYQMSAVICAFMLAAAFGRAGMHFVSPIESARDRALIRQEICCASTAVTGIGYSCRRSWQQSSGGIWTLQSRRTCARQSFHKTSPLQTFGTVRLLASPLR